MILRRISARVIDPRAVIALTSFFASGCEPAPPPPSQEAVTTAQKRSDQAAKQAAEAEQRVQHERRLRDLDRLRHDADVADLSAQVSLLRGLVLVGLLVLLSALVWLVIEIRRRRVLTAMLHATLEAKEGPNDSRK